MENNQHLQKVKEEWKEIVVQKDDDIKKNPLSGLPQWFTIYCTKKGTI